MPNAQIRNKLFAEGYSLECKICYNEYPAIPCEHITEFVDAGLDAEFFKPSTSQWIYAAHKNTYEFAGLPWLGWTKVEIGTELRAGFKEVKLNHARMNSSKITENMGIIGPDSGRLDVAMMMSDFVLGRLDPRDKWSLNEARQLHTECSSTAHGPNQRSLKRLIETSEPMARHKMMFTLVLEGACIPCLSVAYGDSDADENFGIDPKALEHNGTAEKKPQVTTPDPKARRVVDSSGRPMTPSTSGTGIGPDGSLRRSPTTNPRSSDSNEIEFALHSGTSNKSLSIAGLTPVRVDGNIIRDVSFDQATRSYLIRTLMITYRYTEEDMLAQVNRHRQNADRRDLTQRTRQFMGTANRNDTDKALAEKATQFRLQNKEPQLTFSGNLDAGTFEVSRVEGSPVRMSTREEGPDRYIFVTEVGTYKISGFEFHNRVGLAQELGYI
jgi:hypothetical protein